jgi:hypothetical protein
MRRRTKPQPANDRCGVSGKMRYHSRNAAMVVCAQIRPIRESEEAEQYEHRAYECVSCGGWHLTSKALVIR